MKSWEKEAGLLDEDIRKLTDEISVTVTGLAFKEVIDHSREYYDRSVEPKSMQARLFRASEKSRELDAERKAQRDITQKKRNGHEGNILRRGFGEDAR